MVVQRLKKIRTRSKCLVGPKSKRNGWWSHGFEVWLYQYDISGGLAAWAAPFESVEGIWHSSIVVFGKEYWCHRRASAKASLLDLFDDPTALRTALGRPKTRFTKAC